MISHGITSLVPIHFFRIFQPSLVVIDLAVIFNQFNNAIPENCSDPQNLIKEKSLSLFHINSYSLSKNFEELSITETRILKNVSVTQNIVLNNNSFEHTLTESLAGGTHLYIANHLSYKNCNGLEIYKTFELESTFIEIINSRNSNIIVGVIYRNPKMNMIDYNNNFSNNILNKINQEQKNANIVFK